VIRNYHTHTKRCGHAIGLDEEYVLSAISNGYVELGFSDHISHDNVEQNEEYIQSIQQLKEKYKDQIDIKIAFECEYVEERIPYYQQLLKEKKVDYLIFGNHYAFVNQKRIDFCTYPITKEAFSIYYETLKKALDSHLFQYICHPDCFLKGYQKWDEHTIALTHKIASLLSKYDCYVELSGSGSRSRSCFEYNGECVPPYPFGPFFKILSQYPLKFVLGADAHAPEQLNDFGTQFIKDMAKKLNLNVVEKINFNKGEKSNG